jgi:hypothetical protein
MRPPKHPVVDGKKQCSKCGMSKPHTLEFFKSSHEKPGSRAVKYLRGEGLDYRPTGAPFVPDHPKYRDSELRKEYGISLVEYTNRLVFQKGACAICQSTVPRGRTNAKGHSSFHVDHDHISGAFRGLLCHECNVGIGSLQDDPILLERAVNYLRESFQGYSL